jgi:hypothetical protein
VAEGERSESAMATLASSSATNSRAQGERPLWMRRGWWKAGSNSNGALASWRSFDHNPGLQNGSEKKCGVPFITITNRYRKICNAISLFLNFIE